MDKILKFLQKLSSKERDVLLSILSKIQALQLDWLDVKKLATGEDLYRVRKGNMRIIFRKSGSAGVIINIDYRWGVYDSL